MNARTSNIETPTDVTAISRPFVSVTFSPPRLAKAIDPATCTNPARSPSSQPTSAAITSLRKSRRIGRAGSPVAISSPRPPKAADCRSSAGIGSTASDAS